MVKVMEMNDCTNVNVWELTSWKRYDYVDNWMNECLNDREMVE